MCLPFSYGPAAEDMRGGRKKSGYQKYATSRRVYKCREKTVKQKLLSCIVYITQTKSPAAIDTWLKLQYNYTVDFIREDAS